MNAVARAQLKFQMLILLIKYHAETPVLYILYIIFFRNGCIKTIWARHYQQLMALS